MAVSASRYALAYLFWLVSVALAFVALVTSRSSIMLTLGAIGWDRFVAHAINQFGFLLIAILGLAVIIFTEHFYRTGVEQNRLFARFLLVTSLEFLFLMLLHVAGFISELVLGLFMPASLVIIGGEIVLVLLLFWLYRRVSRSATAPRL